MQAPESQNLSLNLGPPGPAPREGELVTDSVWIMSLITQDGESHRMGGVQLVAVYLILGMAFYRLPTPTH